MELVINLVIFSRRSAQFASEGEDGGLGGSARRGGGMFAYGISLEQLQRARETVPKDVRCEK